MNKDISRLVESYFSGVQTDDEPASHQDLLPGTEDGLSPDVPDPDTIPEDLPEDERTIIEISVQRKHSPREYINEINRVICILSAMRHIRKFVLGFSAAGSDTITYRKYMSLDDKSLFDKKVSTVHVGIIFSPDVKIVQIMRLSYMLMMSVYGTFYLVIRDKKIPGLPSEPFNINKGNELPKLSGFLTKELHKDVMIGECGNNYKDVDRQAYWSIFWKIVTGFVPRYGFESAYSQTSRIFDNVSVKERMNSFIFEDDKIIPLKYGEIIAKKYMEGIAITGKNCPDDAMVVFQGSRDLGKMNVLMKNPIIVDMNKHPWVKREETGLWFIELPGTTLQNVSIVANSSYKQIIMTADIVIADDKKDDRNPNDIANYPYMFVMKLYGARNSEFKKLEMLAGQHIDEIRPLESEFESLS